MSSVTSGFPSFQAPLDAFSSIPSNLSKLAMATGAFAVLDLAGDALQGRSLDIKDSLIDGAKFSLYLYVGIKLLL